MKRLTLQGHLRAIDSARAESLSAAFADFRQAIAADPALAVEVQAELGRITDDVAKRCHVSRRMREYLQLVMKESASG